MARQHLCIAWSRLCSSGPVQVVGRTDKTSATQLVPCQWMQVWHSQAQLTVQMPVRFQTDSTAVRVLFYRRYLKACNSHNQGAGCWGMSAIRFAWA